MSSGAQRIAGCCSAPSSADAGTRGGDHAPRAAPTARGRTNSSARKDRGGRLGGGGSGDAPTRAGIMPMRGAREAGDSAMDTRVARRSRCGQRCLHSWRTEIELRLEIQLRLEIEIRLEIRIRLEPQLEIRLRSELLRAPWLRSQMRASSSRGPASGAKALRRRRSRRGGRAAPSAGASAKYSHADSKSRVDSSAFADAYVSACARVGSSVVGVRVVDHDHDLRVGRLRRRRRWGGEV